MSAHRHRLVPRSRINRRERLAGRLESVELALTAPPPPSPVRLLTAVELRQLDDMLMDDAADEHNPARCAHLAAVERWVLELTEGRE